MDRHVVAGADVLPAPEEVGRRAAVVVERPGDWSTLNLGRPAHGASFREIIDVGNWDNSVATSTPGQSGQPRSPFYRNLGRMWEEGDYFPLLYSREAVTQNTAHRLLLLPQRSR